MEGGSTWFNRRQRSHCSRSILKKKKKKRRGKEGRQGEKRLGDSGEEEKEKKKKKEKTVERGSEWGFTLAGDC